MNPPIALIVENDFSFRALIRFKLQHFGFTILEAVSGEAGIEIAIQHTPDLIISDFRLPNVSGYEIWETIHRQTALQNVPFVLLSSAVDSRFGYHHHEQVIALERHAKEVAAPVYLIEKDTKSTVVLAGVIAKHFPSLTPRNSAIGSKTLSKSNAR